MRLEIPIKILIYPQMVSWLPPSDMGQFKKLENAKTSDVKAALLEQGVIADVALGKEVLLEKLFLVHAKKALSEKGENYFLQSYFIIIVDQFHNVIIVFLTKHFVPNQR